jgi:membrane protease YdiL (CAAX protease family)
MTTATSAQPQLLPQPQPFHRLAATGRHRWWRIPLGTALLLGFWFFVVLVVDTVTYGVGLALGYPELPDGTVDFGALPTTALGLLQIAIALPLVLLVVRWIGGRPAGTVSSVTGRLRWGWLGTCLLLALPCIAGLLLTAQLVLPVPADAPDDALVTWPVLATSLIVLVLTVPLQAAAEEYVFRGWLLQAVGAFVRPGWLAVLPQAALFGWAHGWGTAWGFADLCFFGAVAGWLTIRTGGLEAAVALHVLNNLLAFASAALFVGGLESDDTAADAGWQLAVLDMTFVAVYAAVVLWMLRRRERRTAAVPGAEPHRAVVPLGG